MGKKEKELESQEDLWLFTRILVYVEAEQNMHVRRERNSIAGSTITRMVDVKNLLSDWTGVC